MYQQLPQPGALVAPSPLADIGGGDLAGPGGRQVNFFEIIWRRKGIVILAMLLSVAGALLFILKVTPSYTSTARIYVEQNTPKFIDDGTQAAKQSDGYLYTQAELIKSQPIISSALETPGVQNFKLFEGVDNKLMYLKKELDVSVGKKDEIVSVSLSSHDPAECAALVNAIVNSYVTFQSQHRKTTAAEVLRILQKEKDKREQEYNDQTAAMVAFKQANAEIFYETEKGNIVVQDLANISSDLAKAKLAVDVAEGQMTVGSNKLIAEKNLLQLRALLQKYQAAYDAQQLKASAINAKQAEYSKLQNDVTRTEKLLDTLDSRIKELNVTEDAGPLNINILEVARVEDKPTFPRRGLTMAVAVMLGGMLGVSGAFARDWMDQRLKSADEVSDLLGLSVLGIVPSMSGAKRAGVAGRRVELEPSSDVAESFRSLRTALYFGVPDRSKKSILITSPTPGDGKSTSASNLAIALAQAGQRTLLIDADMRKPTQHKIFNLNNERGLSTSIAGPGAVAEMTHRTGVEGLEILTAGPIPPNPSELLNSQAFMSLLDGLAKQYDQIVIDSPPVLPVTDGRILGAICDMTILVLRAEKSTRKASEHAAERLRNVGARLLGAVVNDVPRNGGGYYAGYEQYYQYGYGETAVIDRPARRSLQDTSRGAN